MSCVRLGGSSFRLADGPCCLHLFSARTDVAGVHLAAIYQNMDSEEGGADLGHEWDARLAKTFYRRLTAEVIYANYVSDGFAVDTEKVWFALTFNY